MKNLSPNWITEGILDFEYKQYLLLAYLKEVSQYFDENKLYPFLSDIVRHYQNLIHFKQKKEIAQNQFPKKISKLDLQEFAVEYEKLMKDDQYINEVQDIVDYAIPKLKDQIVNGKTIYEFVEEKLLIYPVGVVPINHDMGYVFMREGEKKETNIFEFQMTIFENTKEKFRGLKMEYVTTMAKSSFTPYEDLKTQVMKARKKYSNPATYVIESSFEFPFQETFLPVAKRKMMQYLAENVA